MKERCGSEDLVRKWLERFTKLSDAEIKGHMQACIAWEIEQNQGLPGLAAERYLQKFVSKDASLDQLAAKF